MTSSLADLKLHGSGKVREIYEDGDELIMVASDRISVYDVILPTEIPDKGKVLTQMSLFWFELTGEIVPNHFISEDVPPGGGGARDARAEARHVPGRVRRPRLPLRVGLEGVPASPAPSAGSSLPEGLQESDKLPEPIFTPATKAELGEHDENIDFDRAAELIGDRPLMEELRRVSIEIYQRGADHAAERGIILADTKFEFGASPGAEVVLGDEVLTPDSSRFWPADDLRARRAPSPPSTSSTSATTRTASAGTTPSPARSCPTRSCRTPERSTSRPTRRLTGGRA